MNEIIKALEELILAADIETNMSYRVVIEALTRARAALKAARPTIVCLCGSTRFWREFQRAGLRETMAGRIVLSIGAASGTDDEHFGNLSKEEYDRVKEMLDQLHFRKIEIADEVLILNLDGYIGESTNNELRYAHELGKRIRFLEPDKAPAWLMELNGSSHLEEFPGA